ncbi:hypothetical protein ACQKWADRAFT_118992 [Trichoderma austrokoningii]
MIRSAYRHKCLLPGLHAVCCCHQQLPLEMDEAALSADTRVETMGLHLTRDGLLTPPGRWSSAISAYRTSTSPSPIPPCLQTNPLLLPTKHCQPRPALQQEPDSARRPDRPSCCAQSLLQPWGESPPMADFLASFNFREEDPELDSRPCTGLEELQLQLRDVLDGKVTATRAERVTTRLDLAASAELTLGVSASENNVLEGLGALDPSLGGALPTDASTDADGAQVSRVVLVNEAVMNQSADEPVLQSSVAKHIAAGVGQVDGSEWVLRDSSRGANGWIFTFICKGSMQHWQRQNKGQLKSVVADYSHRELDPLLGGRPAFDCRGSITISFSRKSKTVSIEYDHLPLHRTVAELSALYQPLIPRRPLPTAEKKAKAPRQPGTQRKKGDTDNATNGEGKKSRKRKRKTDDAGGAGEQGATAIDPSLPTQIGQVGGEGDGSLAGQQQQQQPLADQSAQNSAAGQLVVNVTPEEAERRRNVAMAMLQDAAVDPESLSTDQFNIFANQSPDLQKESLNMLIRYGAERLRIVHPGSKEGSAQPQSRDSSSAPAVQSNVQQDPSGPVTTSGLVLQTATPTSTKKSRKKKQTATNGDVGATGEEATTNGEAKKTRRRGPSKSRNACVQCKQRRVKCPREMPICSECREAGLICEFLPPKQKKPKSNALITIEDDAEGNEELGEPQLEDQQQDDDDDDYAEGFPDMGDEHVHTQLPIGDVLPNNLNVADWEANHNKTSYFPSTTIGVSEAATAQPSHTAGVPISGLVNLIMPSGRPSYYSNMPASDLPEQQTLAHQRKSSTTQSSTHHGPGRDMTARPAQDEGHHNTVNPASVSKWPSNDGPVTEAAAVAKQVVTSMPDQNSHEPVYGLSEPSGNRSSAWRSTNAQQPSLGVSQKQVVSAAALQRPGAASPVNKVPRTSLPKGKQPSKQGVVHNSPKTDQQANPRRSGLQTQTQTGMAGSAAYNNYDRYSNARGAETASTDRISYEPYSYQRDAVSTAPYSGYGHNQLATTAAATSMPAQAANAEVPAADRSGAQTFGPYTTSTQRNQSQNQSASYLGLRAGAQAQEFNNSGSESSHDSRQVFQLRSQSGASRHGQSGMKQDRNYMAYSSHMQQQQQQQQTTHQRASQQHAQHAQQPNQHQTWYNFDNPPSASYASSAGGHGSNYSWSMPGDS